MEEENSKKMDVSYGVDEHEKKSTKKSKKSKTTKKQTQAKKEEPVKKKSLIQEINEMKASGDVRSSEFREKMAKLENILGVDEISPFGTNELDVFEQKLKEMNYASLRQMAHRVGISPFQAEPTLRESLRSQFKAQNKNNMRNIMPESSTVMKLDPNNPKHKKTLDILGEI